MGRSAARKLLAELRGEATTKPDAFEPRLILRKSTARPPS
jgi:DNA-binding LacI/PurR family transcriptional regulator